MVAASSWAAADYVTNNISLQEHGGIGPYASMKGMTFARNYSEAASPFTFSCFDVEDFGWELTRNSRLREMY